MTNQQFSVVSGLPRLSRWARGTDCGNLTRIFRRVPDMQPFALLVCAVTSISNSHRSFKTHNPEEYSQIINRRPILESCPTGFQLEGTGYLLEEIGLPRLTDSIFPSMLAAVGPCNSNSTDLPFDEPIAISFGNDLRHGWLKKRVVIHASADER